MLDENHPGPACDASLFTVDSFTSCHQRSSALHALNAVGRQAPGTAQPRDAEWASGKAASCPLLPGILPAHTHGHTHTGTHTHTYFSSISRTCKGILSLKDKLHPAVSALTAWKGSYCLLCLSAVVFRSKARLQPKVRALGPRALRRLHFL